MILSAILSFFTSGGLGGIAKELRLAHSAKLAAQTDKEKLIADQNLAIIEAQLIAQTRGETTWIPKLIRALWALPLILYLWKLVVWDKLLGWGVTDPLGAYELWVGKAIVSFYFVTGAIGVLRK